MQTMHWYNPVTKEEEDVPAPMNDEQTIGMLSGHPDSDRFIEEYRRLSARHPDTIEALTLTGGDVLPGTPEGAASGLAANFARLVAAGAASFREDLLPAVR
jgi:hypothetical protein